MTGVSDEMIKILSELDMNILVDKRTKHFVESFIDQHGGISEFKKEVSKKRQAPKLPANLMSENNSNGN